LVRVLALDDSRVRFSLVGPGVPRDGAAAFAVDGDVLHLAWAGATWRFDDRLLAPPRKREADLTDGRLTAPMNGRVVAVPAQAGRLVAAGEPLVVLEAMKMEHALTLPAAVTVRSVHVAAGAQVSPGQVLVEFDAGLPEARSGML
jgi:acetyl/propionyl-CoA carboxylase alpha subunit